MDKIQRIPVESVNGQNGRKEKENVIMDIGNLPAAVIAARKKQGLIRLRNLMTGFDFSPTCPDKPATVAAFAKMLSEISQHNYTVNVFFDVLGGANTNLLTCLESADDILDAEIATY